MWHLFAINLCYALRKVGFESDCITPADRNNLGNNTYPEADYYIILNKLFFNFREVLPEKTKLISYLPGPIDFDSNCNEIIDRNNYNEIITKASNYVLAANILDKVELEKNGIATHGILNFGYDEILDPYIYAGQFNRDIDVIFCGTRHERRGSVLDDIEKRMKLNFVNGIWHEDYYKLLARAKIALNVHYFSQKECRARSGNLRILSSVMQKTLMISESIADCSPLVNGEHLILCEWDEIPEACSYYLTHPEEIHEITEKAFDYWTTNYRMDQMLLEFINKHIDSSAVIGEAILPKIQIR